jgi:diguanylate cyclase (GGDEF)-like protein
VQVPAAAAAAITTVLGSVALVALARASHGRARAGSMQLAWAAAAGVSGGTLGIGLQLALHDLLGFAYSAHAIVLGCVLAFLWFAEGLGQRELKLQLGAVSGASGGAAALELAALGFGEAADAPLAAFVAFAASITLIGRGRALENALALARSAAIDAAGDGFAALDGAGELVAANEATLRALDLESAAEDGEANGRALSERVQRRIRGLLADPARKHFTFRTKAGRVFEAWANRAAGLQTLVLRDITTRRKAESRLHKLAHYDSLTGLPNRRFFIEQLERAVGEAQEENGLAALLYLDIDRFKEVNDTLGHSAGDELLRVVAERARGFAGIADEELREALVARLGGDEFAVVLTGLPDIASAERFASGLLAALSVPMPVAERSLPTGASIGVALFPTDGATPEVLAQHADAALYSAKRLGRGRVEFYSTALTRDADRARLIAAGLHDALARGELSLRYQPKVALADERVVGFEALLRWHSAALGVVTPSEFIPIAESRGLIGNIGAWGVTEVCRQQKQWRDAGLAPLPVSVNVSSLQFSQTDLLDVVASALRETGIEGALLEIEITESALLEDPQSTARTLAELRRLGVRVALDDFGTGYSALGHLNDIPLDVLKMDRTFVRDIETSETASGIASAVIAMARTLNLAVVAEGVDSQGQLELLRELGCDLVQGFIYAPPLEPLEAERYFAAGSDLAFPAEKPLTAEHPLDEPADPCPGGARAPRRDGERHLLLLDDPTRSLAPLALRLMRIGIDVHYSSDFDEARLLAHQEDGRVRMVVAPPAIDAVQLAGFSGWLARELSPAPTIVVVGEEPAAPQRAALRKAGVHRVLWSPLDDGELRYWLSSAMALPHDVLDRTSARIPANLMAWLRVGSRRIVGVVSNLSATGAFIELDNPPPMGDSLRVEFELPPTRARLFCKVVHSRPAESSGGFERPAGIGVEFQWIDRATADLIRSAVEERTARYAP